ncbi:MAG TPA: sensor histidine kinase [Jatrophihabitantaceae bacterium]|nr:sensor histidine kinase [Jatrophihabitantaceae bacterium]
MISRLRERFEGRERAVDVLLALFVGGVAEVLAWTDGFLGEHIAGPRWLTAALPLLLGAPLLWRRSQPLLAWSLTASGVALQALVSGNSAEGLEIVATLLAGPYAVAAYGSRRQAVAGLGVLVATYAIYAWNDHNFRSGRVAEKWATAFFAVAALAAWLIGTAVHSRRQEALAAERARLIDEQARAAVADERGRVARELHDIVSHNLSVVVLQAAGARAASERAGFDASDTLEKIEESGREALVEMRRMLGVLRAEGGDVAIAPQPSLRDIPSLVDSVRRAGLTIDAECTDADVPPVIGLSAFRIVQEGLTNVLKHAGTAHAEVVVRLDGGDVLVSVADDGPGPSADPGTGHGLTGMRERVGLLGGELHAGPRNNGGFEVRARLPLPRLGS